ncbi:MAG: hypothetical protein R3B47_14100 [Bacteroidia bacterium]
MKTGKNPWSAIGIFPQTILRIFGKKHEPSIFRVRPGTIDEAVPDIASHSRAFDRPMAQ